MILTNLFLHPLGPALILSLGGVVLAVLRRMARRSAVTAQMIAGRPLRALPKSWSFDARLPVALLAILAATALLVHLRTLSPRPVLSWTWQPLTVAGSVMEWRVDAWNWTASALIIALTGIAILLGDGLFGRPAPMRFDLIGVDEERVLWLGAAALIFVSSGNILTLASSWLILDAALAARLHLSHSGEVSGRAWGALSLAGVLLLFLLALLGENGIRAGLAERRLPGGQALTDSQLVLLWVAALIRAGVYPLHFWLTGLGVSRRGYWLPIYLIGPTAGLWLLGRVHALAGSEWLRRPEWIALSALALLGTALVAWAVEDRNRRWRWIALNRASLAVIAAYTAVAPGPEALVWSLTTFSLGCALLAAGQACRDLLGWRGAVWLAALALWGLPGTVGFFARSALVFPTDFALAIPLFAVVLLAEVLLVASLWETMRSGQAPMPEGQAPMPEGPGVQNVASSAGTLSGTQWSRKAAGAGQPGRLLRLRTAPTEGSPPLRMLPRLPRFASSRLRVSRLLRLRTAPTEGSPPLRMLPRLPRFASSRLRVSRLLRLRVAVATVILIIPLIAFGLFPRHLAALAGWPDAQNFGSIFDNVLGETRRSVWGGMALSAVLGVALGVFRERILGQMRGWQAGIVAIASLEWLYRAVTVGFAFLAGGLRYFADLGEGEGYLGWLALAGLVLWVLLRG